MAEAFNPTAAEVYAANEAGDYGFVKRFLNGFTKADIVIAIAACKGDLLAAFTRLADQRDFKRKHTATPKGVA